MNKTTAPIFVALSVIIGILIGSFFTQWSEIRVSKSTENPSLSDIGKIDAILKLINKEYVDSTNAEELVEKAIPKILSGLDPHSVYIPASELKSANEDLEGSFSGIGVQFNIQKDTVMIVGVISGGPSEKLGILPGDRIVTVDDSTFVGKEITNEKVVKKLRGPKNTTVKVGIKRNSSKDIIEYDITRGDIPVNSVDIAYMLDDDIGYIKVSKFGAHTYSEFVNSIQKLNADKLIIDLRGNSGGYLDAAIQMINEILEKDNMIVYTQTKDGTKKYERADGSGLYTTKPIVVLIDEWSASASEILAGAIQDNDRGLIIGRRSFGKGLVQQQIPLRDGSAIRLTIARYYTPSGRCIQKPYNDDENYEKDIINRYLHGEFDAQDSIQVNKTDTTIYKTIKGRSVYGGGGIMPDIFVPRDTLGVTSYYTKVNNSGYIYEFAFQYTDENRTKLNMFVDYKALDEYLDSQNLSDLFASYTAEKGVRRNPHLISKSKKLIENRLKAYIIRNIFGDSGFYPIIHKTDNTIERAVKELNSENTLTNKEKDNQK